ncbi:hypothetical protein GPECTOR_92g594 [Gonium pectorale]|uniref:Clp R domain-containing protein n=1 Tax=Gonium pectorale TaxID=33097 RepID=A0A150G0L7_GONPE|nr:hypothetical protein GPECTOR_92g594 [Gonium pectorale]|eukprot:KXZ43371.1 hypothetical protein GPECTOR_92g594 [Gonium pectorale]
MQALTSSRVAGARPTTIAPSPCRCPSAIAPRTSVPSVSGRQQQEQPICERSSVRPFGHRHSSLITRSAAAPVLAEVDNEVGVSDAADSIIRYAINLARASETYEVHSWMVLLGILKYENCAAAQILKKLGLEDLYGAWNEVLWALHVCDGLQPRSFTTDIKFADLAFKVVTSASNFALWHGKDKMYSEDLLMALAAGGVLDGLFPDLNLGFDRVRKAVEKHSGRRYVMPDESEAEGERGPLKSEDDVSFL